MNLKKTIVAVTGSKEDTQEQGRFLCRVRQEVDGKFSAVHKMW